jgi:sarcosine oxidase subunit beta
VNKFDTIVVGGGIIGCAVTYYLSKSGQKVLLLERDDHAQGSAGATDGVVSYHTKQPGKQMELALESLKLFEGLSEELGEDIGFESCCGGMQPVEDATQWELLLDVVEQQRKSGVDIRMIGIDEARAIEPQLAPDLYGALYAPSGSMVEPIRLTLAFLHAAKRLGAVVYNRIRVSEIRAEGGAAAGVTTEDGRSFEGGCVVNAAGSWAASVGKMAGLELPVKPRRGQLVVTEPLGPFLGVTLQCARYNIIKFMPESITDESVLRTGSSLSIEQTVDGGLVIGGTREWADYNRDNTLEALELMLRRAVRFFPALRDVSIIRSFAGLRPYTPDGLPLIGETAALRRFYIAAGHEGDGIALAPITGKLLAEQLVLGKTSYPLDAFSPNRFLS